MRVYRWLSAVKVKARSGKFWGWHSLFTVLVLVAVGYYSNRVILTAMARTDRGAYASYYTSATILAYTPHDMARVYDDLWFNDQIKRRGFHDINDIFGIHPPTTGLLWLPLIIFSPLSARLVWAGISFISLLGGLLFLASILKIPKLWGIWVMPGCLIYAPVMENFQYHQAYLLLFFLLCLLFWAIEWSFQQGHDHHTGAILVGGVLSVMVVLKTAALWLWPLLLLSKRWREVIWAGVFSVGIAIISIVWIGVYPWITYMARLPDLAVTPFRYVTAYQTVTSLFGHLLVYDTQWNPTPVADWPMVARTLTLISLLSTLFFSARWGRLTDTKHESRILTIALFISLAVANAPIGEGYHYTTTLVSLVVAYWWAWHGNLGWKLWCTLGMATVLLGAQLTYKTPRLMEGWWVLLAYPRLYGAYLLWGWLGWALCTSSKHTMIHQDKID